MSSVLLSCITISGSRQVAELKQQIAQAKQESQAELARSKDLSARKIALCKSTLSALLDQEKQRNAALVEQLAITRERAQGARTGAPGGACDAESVLQVHVLHAVECGADVPLMDLLS